MLNRKVELNCFMGIHQNYHVQVGGSAFISFDRACAHPL